jgi:hypothetical protein
MERDFAELSEEHDGEGGGFAVDGEDDGAVISEDMAFPGPARHAGRPGGGGWWWHGPQGVPGAQRAYDGVWAYAGDTIDGEQRIDAWGVADWVPGLIEAHADEQVSWEQGGGAPGAVVPARCDEREVGLKAAAVEFGVCCALCAWE